MRSRVGDGEAPEEDLSALLLLLLLLLDCHNARVCECGEEEEKLRPQTML